MGEEAYFAEKELVKALREYIRTTTDTGYPLIQAKKLLRHLELLVGEGE